MSKKGSKGKKEDRDYEEPIEDLKEIKPKITHDMVVNSLEKVLLSLSSTLEDIRKDKFPKDKAQLVKYFHSLNKEIKVIKSNVPKLSGRAKKTPRNTSNTGFNKLVKVSEEMRKFAGWKSDELHSRSDVTRLICNYIKENNLSDPENGRRIKPNRELSKLLDYNKSEDEPLTYANMQKKLKVHFIKNEAIKEKPKA